jgi:hypothetical protein
MVGQDLAPARDVFSDAATRALATDVTPPVCLRISHTFSAQWLLTTWKLIATTADPIIRTGTLRRWHYNAAPKTCAELKNSDSF